MVKNLKCSIGLFNSDFFNFRTPSSKTKNSKCCKFLNSYALKWYEVHRLKQNHFGGKIVYRILDAYKKQRSIIF